MTIEQQMETMKAGAERQMETMVQRAEVETMSLDYVAAKDEWI